MQKRLDLALKTSRWIKGMDFDTAGALTEKCAVMDLYASSLQYSIYGEKEFVSVRHEHKGETSNPKLYACR